MNKFEEFIVKKYPNRSAKVLLHKLQDNDGTWFYAVNEVQDQSEAWQSRQAEVDQQKLLTLDSELHLDAAKEEIERLRGVVDKALNLINNWWHPNVDQKLFIEDVSKALRGHDQYAEHRTKAEEQINKGARLTKHQIDLGGNNANS